MVERSLLEMNDSSRIRITVVGSVLLVVLLHPEVSYGQLPSSRCDSSKNALADCPFTTHPEALPKTTSSDSDLLDGGAARTENSGTAMDSESDSSQAVVTAKPQKQGFHWRRALTESATFLVIEQAYVVHTDFSWVVSENGIPFNHYWRDYMQSLSEWTHSGWNDGDPNWFGYVGHPIQGALTGYIQIQNDPRSQKLVFSKTKEYWWSRFKAFLWNAAYSTEWNLGPVSEVTVEKYGTKDRPPWNYNGSFPCSHHCLTGVGQIDVVMTPLGGSGWLVGEDFLDKFVIQRVEDRTQNHFLIDTFRTALNPVRAGANILHGEHPWYRASRDFQKMELVSSQKTANSARESAKTSEPDHGDVFFGYSYSGNAHCERPIVGGATTCDPLSAGTTDLSGWNTSIEKKYLRYFGAVADFGGQYGSVNQSNYLFGVRGGASIGRLRPFAHTLFGAIHARANGTVPLNPNTTFAQDLGVGADFRMTRRLGWRNQVDVIKTGSPAFERYNVRLSSGLAVRF